MDCPCWPARLQDESRTTRVLPPTRMQKHELFCCVGPPPTASPSPPASPSPSIVPRGILQAIFMRPPCDVQSKLGLNDCSWNWRPLSATSVSEPLGLLHTLLAAEKILGGKESSNDPSTSHKNPKRMHKCNGSWHICSHRPFKYCILLGWDGCIWILLSPCSQASARSLYMEVVGSCSKSHQCAL